MAVSANGFQVLREGGYTDAVLLCVERFRVEGALHRDGRSLQAARRCGRAVDSYHSSVHGKVFLLLLFLFFSFFFSPFLSIFRSLRVILVASYRAARVECGGGGTTKTMPNR